MKVKDISGRFRPLSSRAICADALALLDKLGPDAWKLAGGNDSLVWFKERIKQPKAVVDLAGIDGAPRHPCDRRAASRSARSRRLTEIERSPLISAKYRVLADAARASRARRSATPARSAATPAQDARCPYYRYGLACYRAGGNTCFADTPTGVNREHALFDTDRCVAASPSDTAPALVALDAQMVVAAPSASAWSRPRSSSSVREATSRG